jgi:hypothetical protein
MRSSEALLIPIEYLHCCWDISIFLNSDSRYVRRHLPCLVKKFTNYRHVNLLILIRSALL